MDKNRHVVILAIHFAFFSLWTLSCPAQSTESIVTEGGQTAEFLVRDVFAGTVCENIFDIQSYGDQQGIGYFENASEAIGFDRGIILSTGPITHAMGPNIAIDRSGNFQDNSGDQDLNILATNQVFDAVGLSFDFVPLDSVISFRYVFASEEYCEFVGSAYNDVFGFFVSGPGINGGFTANAENVALVPGSNDFVAINTVNHQQNSPFYVRNDLPEDADACSIVDSNSPHANRIEYDGYTTVLNATLNLIPCQTYRIRMVVGDVGDGYYDSAVFLEAGSFDLGGAVNIDAFGPVEETGVYEGCDDGFFRFTRQNQANTMFPLPVHYTIYGGTANESEDFEPIPRSVTIPVGQTYVDLPVPTINDELEEEIEYIDIALDIPCACYADSARLSIHPPPPLEIELEDQFYICENSEKTISATPGGGNPPYSFLWSNGSSSSQTTLIENGQTNYSLTLTDRCGHELIKDFEVIPVPRPSANISGSENICSGDTTALFIQLNGQSPFQIEYALNGVSQPILTDIEDTLFALPAYRGGTYTLLMVEDAACRGSTSGQAFIEETIIQDNANLENIDCAGETTGSINVTPSGGVGPYQYLWSPNLGNTALQTNLPASNYRLSITDTDGCEAAFQYQLTSPSPIGLPMVDCEMMRELRPNQIEAFGGTPPYQYRISTDDPWFDSNLFNNLQAGISYTLYIKDDLDCIQSFDWLMPFFGPRMATLPPRIEVDLGDSIQIEPNFYIPENLISSFFWTPDEDFDCPTCPRPTLKPPYGRLYNLELTDQFGCSQIVEFRMTIDTEIDLYLPNAFSPNGDNNNDIFFAQGDPSRISKILKLEIYNRWGGLVYAQNDLPLNSDERGWDGQTQGQNAKPGVYLYLIEVELFDGKREVIGGDVVLIR